MNREMQEAIKRSKQSASELVRYANPKTKERPSIERITENLLTHIPYRGERPSVVNFNIVRYNKNRLIKSASYRVELSDGRLFVIDAYVHLVGRSQQEKDEDKIATFPSGLFNTFHTDITDKEASR